MRKSFERIKSVIQESGTVKIAIAAYAALLIGTAVIAGMQNYCQWTGCSLPRGIGSIDTSKVGMVVATAATATAFLLTLYNVQVNFWRKREHVPHLTMTLRIQRTKASPSLHVLTATLDAKNTGSALCEIEQITWSVRVIAPYDDEKVEELRNAFEIALRKESDARTEFPWDSLENRETVLALEVEPGESDQVTEDFIVPPEATTIAVTAYVHNAGADKEGAEGWYRRTIHSDQEVEDAI